MKIQNIVDIADKAYPDGLIGQYWDAKRQRPVGEKKARTVGDGLAGFILRELVDTFDPDASDETQINEAIRVMETVRREVDEIIGAFEKKSVPMGL